MATATVAANPGTAAPAKSGKLGSVLLLLVGMVLGAGITLGAVKFVYAAKPAEPAVEKTTEGTPADVSKVRQIVALKPFIVNMKGTHLNRYLRVVVGLEVSHPEVVDEINHLIIPVGDFMVDRLSAAPMDELDGSVGRNKLKRELAAGLNEMLEKGTVTRVYFSEFVVQ